MSEKTAFLELQAKWYARLIAKGFRDIESHTKAGYFLKQNGNRHMAFLSSDVRRCLVMDAVQEYYRWCGHMVHDGRFKSNRDKKIWRMHSEGIHHNEIAREFKKDRSTISWRIKRIEAYLKRKSNDHR